MEEIDDFYQRIYEAKDQIDISILAAAKYLTSEKKKEYFLSTPCTVEMKYDGLKLTLVYKDNTGDYTKDWILAYKGVIQYPGEYDFASTASIKKSSIGNAQYKVMFDYLKKITPTLSGIPKNTEFFIEFLGNKPTLSSNYKNKKFILLASSPCTWTDEFGILRTKSTFNTINRSKYSKILGIQEPQVIFSGVLGNQSTFEKSIKAPEFLKIYNQYKTSLDYSNIDSLISTISEMFLSLDSKFSDNQKEEGVVIIFPDKILKFQQPYQVNQEARAKIKLKYKEPTEDQENQYWDNVRLVALNIISTVTRGITVKYIDFPDTLTKCAKVLKSYKLDFNHSKKNNVQVKDDISGNIQMILRKNLKGNNNALFLGKFRVLTNAHYKIIKRGLRDYDGIVICIVTSKDTKYTKDIRNKMVQATFGNNPKIEIINHGSGNIFGIMQKAIKNINTVLAGTDRASSYRSVLSRNPDINVQEIKRDDSSISASKVIENINDEKYFDKNTPKEVHKFYKDLLKIYFKDLVDG